MCSSLAAKRFTSQLLTLSVIAKHLVYSGFIGAFLLRRLPAALKKKQPLRAVRVNKSGKLKMWNIKAKTRS